LSIFLFDYHLSYYYSKLKKIQNLFWFSLLLPHDKPLAIIAQHFTLRWTEQAFPPIAKAKVLGK